MTPLKLVNSKCNAGRRGIIMLMFTLSFVFLVLVVGLAIDSGLLYVVKVKLQAAADAAALAAARSLNTSLTSGQQLIDAQAAATAFFAANFPTSYLNTSGSSVSTGLQYGTGNNLNTAFITTTSSTNAPAYFMRWFGYTTVPISVTGTASRRDINLMLLLDRSGSMTYTQPGTGSTACALMKTAAQGFVNLFSNNRDTLGLVEFNASTSLAFAPATNFNAGITSAISSLSCGGDTNTAQGLKKAYDQLVTLNQSTKLNVIVLFTDGQAESITATFPVKTVSDSRYGDGVSPYGTTSMLYTMPASGCVAAVVTSGITGAIAENDATGAPDLTGPLSGAFDQTNLSEPTVAGSGCAFKTSNNSAEIRRDIAYIPSTDYYGNSTSGHRTDYNFFTSSYVTGQDSFPSGPYMGQIRPDQIRTLFNVGFNTTEAQGITIRNNTTINPLILTIGLGGNGSYPADSELLIRLANVPSGLDPSGNTITNGIYDSTKPQGLYVYSPSSSQLSNAFAKVGSFLVELSH
jgi:Flp pilus assembly protein TadG